jgi:hypothetical protein
MGIGDALSIFSQIINFVIFIYFVVTLLKVDALDLMGLFISAFGLFASLVANIISVLEERSK